MKLVALSFQDYKDQIQKKYPTLQSFQNYVKNQLNERKERLVKRQDVRDKEKEAAVLFSLIIPKELSETRINASLFDNIFILLEKRAINLSKNPGDMSFPGGRVDEEDEDPIQTAYREAEEEVGIQPRQLEFAGFMDEFVSNNGMIVRTIVSWLYEDLPIDGNLRQKIQDKYHPRTPETDNTVVVPFSHFLDPENYSSTEYFMKNPNGSSRVAYVRYYYLNQFLDENHVWGLTASMVRRFMDIIFPDNLLPHEPVVETK